MQLYCWRGEVTNFGDELNRLLWPALLPGLFDENPAEIVLGIGSVLDRRHSDNSVKIVLGSGYGGYQPRPRLDRSWVIHWVRGPRTAALLGLPDSVGLGDPAMLLPCVGGFRSIPTASDGTIPKAVGFMPHFESLGRGTWTAAARLAGVRLIDPRWQPERVVAEIAACSVLLSEAMHGAIVADVLRVPWIAMRPVARIHRAKWLDWAGALNLELRFQPLPASSTREWVDTSRMAERTPVRQLIRAGWLGPPDVAPRHSLDRRLVESAAAALRQAVVSAPMLSSEKALQRSQDRMLTCLEVVRRYRGRRGVGMIAA